MKSGTNTLSLTSKTDYYPGGMAMPNRNVVGDYRYDYQGQELDPETGKVAFELRLYDPRINRWLSPNPMGEFHSPYLSMGNNWINKIDPTGGITEDPPTEGTFTNGQVWNDADGSWTYNSADNVWADNNGGGNDIFGSAFSLSEVSITTSLIGNKIANTARGYLNSTLWGNNVATGNFSVGTNKCNKFVSACLQGVGIDVSNINGNFLRRATGNGYPPVAGQWANPNYNIEGFRVLGSGEDPIPGDIVGGAFPYSDATGHVAIFSGYDDNGNMLAIGTNGVIIIENDWPHRAVHGLDKSHQPIPPGQPRYNPVTFRRYNGN